jgi:nicotinate-nucleotide pyrophosphorylase (carboxylating)
MAALSSMLIGPFRPGLLAPPGHYLPAKITPVNWPALLDDALVQRLIVLALQEDIGSGDVTTEAIFQSAQQVSAHVIARTPTVVCGLPLAVHLLRRFDDSTEVLLQAEEGADARAGERLLAVSMDVRALLTAERCLLNFLMRLCGVAAGARAAARAVPKGYAARIYDTRKTTPGLRLLEKAAVATGGAQNHRVGLHDAVLIKDNHIAAAGSITAAIERARARVGTSMAVEVEIDHLHQLDEALDAKPDIVLLDNFTDEDLAVAVRRAAGVVELEASGGVTLERIPAIARTGVDRISMGSLTHSAQPADLSLEIVS